MKWSRSRTSAHRRPDDYERDTRDHYVNPGVAAAYERNFHRPLSPDWLVARSETRIIADDLRQFGAIQSMLDLPAGTGKLFGLLAGHTTDLVSADISESMLALHPPANKVVCDATSIPYPDQAFDVVVSLRLLHRVPTDVFWVALTELHRVAGRGVCFSFAGTSRAQLPLRAFKRLTGRPDAVAYRPSLPELTDALGRWGFDLVSSQQILGGFGSEVIALSTRRAD